MKTILCNALFMLSLTTAYSQSNSFPLYSSGSYSGGTADYTNISSAQLKLVSPTGYVRVPHISADATVSTVYNFESGKNAYWGEPADVGLYRFRGRHLIVEQGNLGIGAFAPTAKIEISNYDGMPAFVGRGTNSSYVGGDLYLSRASTQTSLGRGVAIELHDIGSGAHTMIQTSTGGLQFFNYNSGWLECMRITSNGNVGIGSQNPNQKLTVNGTIYGKEVKVDLAVPGPDYVFEKDYALPTLEQVKDYVDSNKHLPGVPSAREMEGNGINVSEMNMSLLKKIEELTLYSIEMKRQMQDMQMQIDELKKSHR